MYKSPGLRLWREGKDMAGAGAGTAAGITIIRSHIKDNAQYLYKCLYFTIIQ